jgi:hypothetical protein
MRVFGILLIFANIAAGAGFVYLATQDWKGRQQINAAGLRHVLLLQGLPLEGQDFNADDETPFEVEMAGGERTKTISKKLLEAYFTANTVAGSTPAVGTPGVEPPPAARVNLASTAPVTNQIAEVKRILGILKTELSKDGLAPARKVELLEGWLLLQAETYEERSRYQTLIVTTDAAGRPKPLERVTQDAEELAHELDKRFYRVAPKLYDSPESALSPAKWQELQKKIADAGGDQAAVAALKPPIATIEGDRALRLVHLLVHLEADGAWQKRIIAVVGLRKYVAVVASQQARFRDMRAEVELPIPGEQATFQEHQNYLMNETRRSLDRAKSVSEEKVKLIEQKIAADDAVNRRRTQLKDLEAQLKKLKDEVDELLVTQTGIEQKLLETQRNVSLTLEEVYRLERLLAAIERERYGLPPKSGAGN